MEYLEVSVLKDFSRTPGPRFSWEGDDSGELFRQNVLCPKFKEALESGLKLRVNLDGTAGYGTSFLEESFGGLIRKEGFTKKQVEDCLVFISDEEEFLIEDIFEYINDAEPEK